MTSCSRSEEVALRGRPEAGGGARRGESGPACRPRGSVKG